MGALLHHFWDHFLPPFRGSRSISRKAVDWDTFNGRFLNLLVGCYREDRGRKLGFFLGLIERSRGENKRGARERTRGREVTFVGFAKRRRAWSQASFAWEEVFQVRALYSPLFLFIIFSILLLDVTVCFGCGYQAICLAFIDLWNDYGFVVIVLSSILLGFFGE